MSPAEIIEQAAGEGVILAISPAGKISASGEQSLVDLWLPTIRNNKAGLLCELRRNGRREKVLAMLAAAPGTHYAVIVADASTDPVVVAVGIRDVATFELEIPYPYYDGLALLELVETRCGEAYANA
jgi:hypothetical protein